MTEFRNSVEADLLRAHGMALDARPGRIETQLRVASPEGNFRLSIRFESPGERRDRQVRQLKRWLAWKQTIAFTIAAEQRRLKAIACAGVSRAEIVIGVLPSDEQHLDGASIEWYGRENADDFVLDLLPKPQPFPCDTEIAELTAVFGLQGPYPAVPSV